MHKLKLLTAVLDLFDGEGAPGASSPDAGESMGESAEAEAGNADQQESKEKVPFEQLISGEYAEDYKRRVEEAVKKRHKDYRDLQQTVTNQNSVLDMLYGKYKVNDIESLTKAIEDDDAMWESAAYEAGMTTEQYKAYQKLERENSRLRQAEQQIEAERQAQQQVAKWQAEAVDLKTQFPDFDLEQELLNDGFRDLLTRGISMDAAYKVAHFNDLMGNAVYTAAVSTEKKITDNIRAKGNRPVENGTTSQSAFTIKSDPSKWTKKDRADIARRAARGEKITI